MPEFKLPSKLKLTDIIQAVSEDRNAGFCLNCGEEVEGVEPDARRYECEACGEPLVYGAEELLIMFA